MSDVIATSRSEVENEVDQAWAQTAKRTKTMVKEDKKNPGTYKVSLVAPPDDDGDSSDDMHLLSSVWGNRMQFPGTMKHKKNEQDANFTRQLHKYMN